jgi:hypothetical protein
MALTNCSYIGDITTCAPTAAVKPRWNMGADAKARCAIIWSQRRHPADCHFDTFLRERSVGRPCADLWVTGTTCPADRQRHGLSNFLLVLLEFLEDHISAPSWNDGAPALGGDCLSARTAVITGFWTSARLPPGVQMLRRLPGLAWCSSTLENVLVPLKERQQAEATTYLIHQSGPRRTWRFTAARFHCVPIGGRSGQDLRNCTVRLQGRSAVPATGSVETFRGAGRRTAT